MPADVRILFVGVLLPVLVYLIVRAPSCGSLLGVFFLVPSPGAFFRFLPIS